MAATSNLNPNPARELASASPFRWIELLARLHPKKEDSGNRRQGGGGWGTPLKKRSATRIKLERTVNFPESAEILAAFLSLQLLEMPGLSPGALDFKLRE